MTGICDDHSVMAGQRLATAPVNNRVDKAKPVFSGNRPSYRPSGGGSGSGSGALDLHWAMLILLLGGVAFLGRRRGNTA